jgi:hypothetical protein
MFRAARRVHLATAICLLPVLLHADPPKPSPPATPTICSLADFGPVDTPAHAQATYQAAIHAMRAKGGVLVVPGELLHSLKPLALQGLERTPPPPEQTKQWKTGPGVTEVSVGREQPVVRVPPLSGLKLDRDFRLDDGDSTPHWGTHPMLTLDSRLTYGPISYLDWLQAPVEKGKDRRFYLATVRGLHPGHFINIHGHSGYGGGVIRACVKSLGYDPEKQLHYLVADTDHDHKPGAILQNKINTGLIHMLQTSNADNQTYDVKVIRNQYAHGDTYVYYCDFNYMSNVHSAAGDENGNCYGAFIRSLDSNFRGTVESVDWKAGQLKFAPACQNVQTLGDSRPLVNLNPKKAVTQGKVWIVPAQNYVDPVGGRQFTFAGKAHPTVLATDPVTGAKGLKVGGLIRGDKDCPWTQAVVGRWFAVANPEEKTPKGNFRWYMITSLKINADGTKDIEIQRFWWGAKSAGSPLLYRQESYSWDGHLRPLDYIIAPGTYVNDVSRAIPGGDRGGQRLLGVVPYADQGTALDFEPGDPVEQAIGPDPFKPQAMRVWMWEDVPGSYPSAVFDVANHGAASRHAVLRLAGGGSTLEEVAKRHEQKPAWDNVLYLNSAATVGMNCQADFADAAILFAQPNREQPIKWHYGHADGKPAKEAALTVSKATGELNFEGRGLRTNGPVSAVTGLSADKTPAQNLRGKNVAVQENAASIRIRFATPEADGDYAVFVEQSWPTNRAISEKGPEGFTVSFATAAPDGAKLDWMIVR